MARDFPCCLQAIHLRHREIEHNYIGAELRGFTDRFPAVAGIPAYAPVRVGFNQTNDEAANREVVIGNENAYRHFGEELSVRVLRQRISGSGVLARAQTLCGQSTS